jgi:hypothetical protein
MTRAASRPGSPRTLDEPRVGPAVDPVVDAAPKAAEPAAPPVATPPVESGWGLPLAVIVIGMFMSVLNTTSVNVALASMANDLGASTATSSGSSTPTTSPSASWCR